MTSNEFDEDVLIDMLNKMSENKNNYKIITHNKELIRMLVDEGFTIDNDGYLVEPKM